MRNMMMSGSWRAGVCAALTVALAAGVAHARGGEDAPEMTGDWWSLESPLLTDHVRLTSPEDFARAGEAYFSPDGSWIIFQATPRARGGEDRDPHYSMYVAPLERDEAGIVTGLGEPIRISPPGSANTCGWFHPEEKGKVLFGSTLEPPAAPERPGFRVGTRQYQWAFPREMQIVTMWIGAIEGGGRGMADPEPLFQRDGYTAEGSWSPCGRFVLYAQVDPDTGEGREANLYIFDTETEEHHAIVTAEGYDGGPFFSPCGTKICYRSDRDGTGRMRMFVGELEIEDGVPVGLAREIRLTGDSHVDWAPYWHPSGEVLAYTSSRAGHWNYEIYAIDPAAEVDGERRIRRMTFSQGFDGLPVFSPDGNELMWTSQRKDRDGSGGGTSQLWIARTVAEEAGVYLEPLTETQARTLAEGHLGQGQVTMEAPMIEARLEGRDWIVEAVTLDGTTAVRVGPDGVVEPVEPEGADESAF